MEKIQKMAAEDLRADLTPFLTSPESSASGKYLPLADEAARSQLMILRPQFLSRGGQLADEGSSSAPGAAQARGNLMAQKQPNFLGEPGSHPVFFWQHGRTPSPRNVTGTSLK